MKLLITSIEELSEVVTFSGDIEFVNLKSALRSAQEFLVGLVGPQLLAELGEDSLSDDQRELLTYVVVPIGNLAMLKYANANVVRMTDLGVMRTKDANSGDAFEWQLERVVSSLQTEAFEGLESLLRYLATNLSKFPSYADSAPYKQEKSRLIQSAEVFNLYYNIGGSRLILHTLQASMRTAEITIRKTLGNTLATLLADNLTDDQIEQLDAARRALVYATIARALRERLVSITENGVQVSAISQTNTINYKTPASDKQLERSIQYFDEQAAIYQGELIALLPPAPVSTAGSVNPVIKGKITAF